MTVPDKITSSSSKTPTPQATPTLTSRSLKVQRRYRPQFSGALMFFFIFRRFFKDRPMLSHSHRLSHPLYRLNDCSYLCSYSIDGLMFHGWASLITSLSALTPHVFAQLISFFCFSLVVIIFAVLVPLWNDSKTFSISSGSKRFSRSRSLS